MKILFSPCRNDNEKIFYSFSGDTVTATYKDVIDTFDLSTLNDGESLDIINIQTALSFNPIISAKRESGVVKAELLNFIGENATENEKFPQWVDV